jgi:hypothetical protein
MMTRTKHDVHHGVNGHGSRTRPRPLTLQADALGAPIFRETWNAGAPLDWTDFMRQCGSGPAPGGHAEGVDSDR